MNEEPKAPSERKVGVYDRPASADRPTAKWIVWSIAIAVSLAWAIYFFFYR